ncbi:MFS transporter [Lactococcus lactis]|uniref:MFS transporter n=1 Tax=Lactococcus lactis TaxID=1358 RepID=UPI00071D4368|nr:MFS transporter [Lactococcus lactis]KSU13455.1 Multidrug-efflux transporter major facilitator superfamily (MFS) Efflux pump Lde [Lactococcus lactis subsp. lactis]MDG4964225.1 MFS transporter [Lactococcus lactis]MDU0399826.1 Tetracycline resistance protein, class C [Lactococcus lactis]
MKINKHALIFGLITTFLTGLGFTIISPVVPFMVAPFANAHDQALIVTSLMAIYALCTFFAAPALGSLSDRFGRKPILLISLAGSALGYLIFGLAGSLWMLFLGRIIDGLTGGNIVTLFAYFADITDEENRTKVFGWTAAAVGVGTISGPTVGGLLAHFGNSVPFYFGALISIANLLYGAFVMNESLPETHRTRNFSLKQLNPFTQLFQLLRMKNLNRLLFAGILLWLPNGALQAIISQFSLDSFAWTPVLIGLAISIMGLMDILTQIFIMPRLLKLANEDKLIRLALVCEIIAYLLFALSAFSKMWAFFILAMFIFAFGDSIFGTAFNGKLSKSATSSEQGKLQGGSQALQALARVIGPLIGGQIYISLGHFAPALMGFIFLIIALLVLSKTKSDQE